MTGKDRLLHQHRKTSVAELYTISLSHPFLSRRDVKMMRFCKSGFPEKIALPKLSHHFQFWKCFKSVLFYCRFLRYGVPRFQKICKSWCPSEISEEIGFIFTSKFSEFSAKMWEVFQFSSRWLRGVGVGGLPHPLTSSRDADPILIDLSRLQPLSRLATSLWPPSPQTAEAINHEARDDLRD